MRARTIQKLESSAADEVYLVIPKRSPILRTPLEFRILARLTHQLSSETIIVTGDGNRRSLARQEGLRTRRSVRSLRHLSRPPGTRSWGMPGLPDWLPLPSFTGILLTGLVAGIAVVLLFGVLPVMKVSVQPQVVQQAQGWHKDIEFGNRMLTFAVGAAAVAVVACVTAWVVRTRAPKRLLVYRTAVPFAGRKRHPLEVLARGQQFVAYAVHPNTGRPYDTISG